MILQELIEKFFAQDIDETDSWNISLSFQEDEPTFKNIFLTKIPSKINISLFNLISSNLDKLKDHDAQFIIKYLFHHFMIKRSLISPKSEEFYSIYLSNKDFQKVFCQSINDFSPEDICYTLTKLANLKQVTLVEEFFTTIKIYTGTLGAASNKYLFPAKGLDNFQKAIILLPESDIYQIHLMTLDAKNYNCYREIDYLLNGHLKDDQEKYFKYLSSKLESGDLELFNKLENVDFIDYFVYSYLFDNLIKSNTKLKIISQPLLNLAKKNKESVFIFENADFFDKRMALRSLMEIGDSRWIKEFIDVHARTDELKDLAIYI